MTADFKNCAFLQQTWREEVWEYTERVKGEDSSLPLIDHDILVRVFTTVFYKLVKILYLITIYLHL
jgi:hypothetical protein